MLTAIIGFNGVVSGDLIEEIGYAGEGLDRMIQVEYPTFNDPVSKMIVKMKYFDEVIQFDVTSNKQLTIPKSYMEIGSKFEFKFYAYREDELVFQSEIWNIGVSKYLTFHELGDL